VSGLADVEALREVDAVVAQQVDGGLVLHALRGIRRCLRGELVLRPRRRCRAGRAQVLRSVTLIDAGEYTTRITCSCCNGDISLHWLGDLVRENRGESFDHLDVTVPCCGAVIELDSLRYEEPIGLARFEISAMNPTRAEYKLDAKEPVRVADLLGHPVAQILAHH
jgi:hypothetical protein